jgi:hypothetical protein
MSAWSAGPEPYRVVEVLAGGPAGDRRGSGYLVNPATVLTATHVVRGAATVQIRFDGGRPGQWLAAAAEVLIPEDGDVAAVVIAVTDRTGGAAQAEYGRLGGRAAVLRCQAVGFPRWKLRLDGAHPYRDRAHVQGRLPVLSNSKDGTLEIVTDPPEHDPDPRRSPWEGMSGTAVWVGGRIVGVVSEHHRLEGLSRLAAARVDRWPRRSDGPVAAGTRARLGLPADPAALPDAAPTPPGQALAAGYLEQVRDILPAGRLLDRRAELDELTAFCAGDEPYGWWQAGPWAGKSALAAWLVLHPPAGVDVVSFFITSRWAGHADSDAFTTELVQQLALIAGEPEPRITARADWQKAFRHLLGTAADRVAGRGRRLLLVVDGLDEDRGAEARLPSIAGLLPPRPPDALRILVTSRPHPGLPADIPVPHPLRSCPARRLEPSPYAGQLAERARAELWQRRQDGDPRHVDLLGVITASGGGLTRSDIAALTGIKGWELTDLFGTVFDRTLRGRAVATDDRVYLFAHETLRVEAERLFADDLAGYRDRVHGWADTYRERARVARRHAGLPADPVRAAARRDRRRDAAGRAGRRPGPARPALRPGAQRRAGARGDPGRPAGPARRASTRPRPTRPAGGRGVAGPAAEREHADGGTRRVGAARRHRPR